MKYAAFTLGCYLLMGMSCFERDQAVVAEGIDWSKYRNVAIVEFKGTAQNEGSGDLMANYVQGQLIKRGFKVVERNRVNEILKEQAFQSSDYSAKENAVKLGKILNVSAIIIGQVTTFVNEPRTETYTTGGYYDSKGKWIPQRKHTDNYNYSAVGATMKIIDVESGEVLYLDEGSEDGRDTMPERLAQKVSVKLVSKLPNFNKKK